jgi:uncharacterized protein (DUF58 family)
LSHGAVSAVKVSRKRIRTIRITRTGWAFILLTIGIGIAGLNTGNNLLYLIFGMLLSMLLINGILSTSSLNSLEVRFDYPQRLFAMGNNPVRIELLNHKRRLPSYALTLIPPFAEALDNDGFGYERRSDLADTGYFLFKIAAASSERLVHYQSFTRRGRLDLPAFRLITSYPFGLIEKHVPLPLAQQQVIYPALLPEVRELLASSTLRGDYLSGDRGVGVNPYGIRQHQHGDDIRHLHWPSFAKVGRWMIKEFEQEKKSQITVHLKISMPAATPNAPPNANREAAISLAASLIMYFVEQHRQVGLWINNHPIVPGDGGGYIDYYLTALALFDSGHAADRYLDGPSAAPNSNSALITVAESDAYGAGATHLLLPSNLAQNMESADSRGNKPTATSWEVA